MALVEVTTPEGYATVIEWAVTKFYQPEFYEGGVARDWDDNPSGCYPVIVANEPGGPQRLFAATAKVDLLIVRFARTPFGYVPPHESHNVLYYYIPIADLTAVEPSIT